MESDLNGGFTNRAEVTITTEEELKDSDSEDESILSDDQFCPNHLKITNSSCRILWNKGKNFIFELLYIWTLNFSKLCWKNCFYPSEFTAEEGLVLGLIIVMIHNLWIIGWILRDGYYSEDDDMVQTSNGICSKPSRINRFKTFHPPLRFVNRS